MPGDYFYYFAYGSNLLRERISINSPTAIFCTTAKLPNFKLCFGGKAHKSGEPTSTTWGGYGASIFPSEGREVWGTVWKIHNDNMEALDRQEAVHLKFYFPKTVEPIPSIRDFGEKLNCRTYQMVDEFVDVDGVDVEKPSLLYKSVIVAGARQNGLPQDYIENLQSIQDNGFKGNHDEEWLKPVLEAIQKNGGFARSTCSN